MFLYESDFIMATSGIEQVASISDRKSNNTSSKKATKIIAKKKTFRVKKKVKIVVKKWALSFII